MKRGIGIALVLAGFIAALPGLAQQGSSGAASSQGKQQAQPVQQPKKQDSNPFPTDTTNVPVMPSRENPDPNVPNNGSTPSPDQIEDTHYPVPGDSDPVTSPDAAPAEGSYRVQDQGQVSSSNSNALDSILPPPGDDDTKGKKGSQIEDMPQETAEKDISVAKYYLDNKNWRAAQSRFQSALVLAPEDPEVYWGLAESQRHIGDFANARKNYEKVIEYDPDSKHAKDARKALKEPDLANAKPAPAAGQPQK